MPDKRQPLLADYSSMKVDYLPDANRLIPRVKAARRFVLDESATRRYAEVVRDIPELLFREQQFARAPYDVTWIEYDFATFYYTLHGRAVDDNENSRCGFLIDHGTAYVFAGGKRREMTLFPVCYDLHKPMELIESPIAGTDWDTLFWGDHIHRKLPEELRASLRQHSARFLPLSRALTSEEWHKVMHAAVRECFGDLRNLIAILLLMNRPSLTQYVREVPHWRGFIKGKLRPYMSHTVVTIPLDPKPTLRKIGTLAGDAIEKRRHEVRGTYCHDELYRKGTKAGCIHNFIPDPKHEDDPDRWHFIPGYNPNADIERDNWVCKDCGGHRWWREDHHRGNAALGFVEKSYKITEST